jgi:nucleoside-diphosphate-sugar epimerase
VDVRQGDLADAGAVIGAARDCDLVFHVAAKAGIWGPYGEYYQTNVVGTQNVIAACRHCQIRRLVYTSSPSVIFDGRDMEGVNESAPYPRHFEASYPKSKAMAEQLVLQANDKDLATVALRPHLIWGPGDNHLIPRIIARAKAGTLRRMGNKINLVDCVYVDNAAHAHLLAAERLWPGSPVAGKAYFISQGDPRPLWELIGLILQAAGLPPVKQTISPALAYTAGWFYETAHRILRIKSEPKLTRFLVRELSTAHWFDISAARRDLGYEPKISIEEGIAHVKSWLKTGQ